MTNVGFEHIEIRECGEPLLNLADFSFVLEPAYFNAGLSADPRLFSRQQIVEKLLRAQERLGGYRFKIWDPWRSRNVQRNIYQKFWSELSAKHPDWTDAELKIEVGKFVTIPDSPERIPPHSTGGAIDLTLVGPDGHELDMGTCFDHFGPESASDYFEVNPLSVAIRDNRRRLREAMLNEDFRADTDEWFHYDFGNQLWAAAKGASCAIYGEKVSPP